MPLSARPDLAALLAYIYSKASTPQAKDSSVILGCVPLNSPYLSPDGKRLLTDQEGKAEHVDYETDAARARKEDLYGWGCIGKVSGVQGRRQGELSLVVEGLRRFEVLGIARERPYFEAWVQEVDEPSKSDLRFHCSRPLR